MFKSVLQLLGLKRVLIILAAVVTLLGLFSGFSYHRGYQKANTLCISREQSKTITGITNHGKIKNEVIRLPDPDLDERLSKWMRD